MKRGSPAALLLILVAAILADVRTACAQPVAPNRLFRGLFGGVNGPPVEPRHSLIFNVSLAEAYDDDVYRDLSAFIRPEEPQVAGYYSMLVADASYAKQGRRGSFAASGTSSLRYYNDLEKVKSVSHSAALGFSLFPARGTTLTFNQSAAYSPSYLYGLFPQVAPPEIGEAPVPSPDYATVDLESYSYTTSATFRHQLSLRNSLNVSADFRYLDYVHYDPRRRDVRGAGVAGEFLRDVSRNLSVSGRYRYRAADLGYTLASRMTRENGLDVRFSYKPSFSPSQSLNVDLRLGAAILDIPELDETFEFAGRHAKFTGELGVGYWFGRTWSTRASYRHGVEYLAELKQPVVMRGAGVDVSGLFAEQLDLLVSARYATGESAYTKNGLFFDTYTANTRLRYALTKTMAAYAEYLYYFYDFHGSALLPRDIPDMLERNAVRVGMMFWLPALQR